MPTLKELNAHFIGADGEGVWNADGTPAPARHGVGVVMDCPCGCKRLMYVPFKNPLDGGPQYDRDGWERTGDTLETLTLRPSVLRVPCAAGECSWHGYITNGEAKPC